MRVLNKFGHRCRSDGGMPPPRRSDRLPLDELDDPQLRFVRSEPRARVGAYQNEPVGPPRNEDVVPVVINPNLHAVIRQSKGSDSAEHSIASDSIHTSPTRIHHATRRRSRAAPGEACAPMLLIAGSAQPLRPNPSGPTPPGREVRSRLLAC